MMELLTNPAFLALLGTIFGGAGLKFIEHLLNRTRTQEDIASSIRKELRQDVESLRATIRVEEAETNMWRERYWAEVENRAQDKAANALHVHKIKELARAITAKHPEVDVSEIFDLPD